MSAPAQHDDDDPFVWLEDVDGERALAWVRERNAESQALLAAEPGFDAMREMLRAQLDGVGRIPAVTRRGRWLYNLWQDGANPLGLWRRTTLAEYRKPDPAWETVLDLDALAAAEGVHWVWAGVECLGPAYRHAMIALSRGGADACVRREFDCEVKAFVPDGFVLAEAKSKLTWIDADTLYVATDFGPGSLTESGYPRIVKRWRRGTPLTDAKTIFEAPPECVAAMVHVDATPGFERTIFERETDFFHRETFLLGADDVLVPFDIPSDSTAIFWRDVLLLAIRSDWQPGATRFAAGSLLATDAATYLRGERALQPIFTPTPTRALAGVALTRERVLVSVLDDVTGRLEQWQRDGAAWRGGAVEAPRGGTLSVAALHDPLLVDDELAEHYLLSFTDFLTPETLHLVDACAPARHETLKAAPPLFDASGMRSEQCFATSRDGTRVPYFVVWPRGADATTPADGSLPTLLYGYGGFEIALEPAYAPATGAAWHARGGVRVVANLRGGGEYGPAWHRAAQREHKQRSYDDMIAVAEDLIARRITSPRRLGIMGRSNGGLMVGAVFTQRPDLFNAVVCAVPLLDMRRFHRLLAGASWIAEFGDPDEPADWEFIRRYSPYHQVRAGQRYPRVFFNTSTRDDRVHPAHARKMAAKMLAQGHAPLYYENIEGGHGGAADNAQRAHLLALEFAFLWRRLDTANAAVDAADSAGAIDARACEVLEFWFGAPGSAAHGTSRPEWFRKDPAFDREIAERFGPLVDLALGGGLREWDDAGAQGTLARILLLDQFPRNIFRGSARSFAGDVLAQEAAQAMVAAGRDLDLPLLQRWFVYLPYEHAEDAALQDESLRLFGAAAQADPAFAGVMDYVHRHRDIVLRFGRFPHRNAWLGRASTEEEIAFLREPGSSF